MLEKWRKWAKMTSLWRHKYVKITFYKKIYFFQTSRHISFKIGWVDFPYNMLVMDLFRKKCYFLCFCRISLINPLLKCQITKTSLSTLERIVFEGQTKIFLVLWDVLYNPKPVSIFAPPLDFFGIRDEDRLMIGTYVVETV